MNQQGSRQGCLEIRVQRVRSPARSQHSFEKAAGTGDVDSDATRPPSDLRLPDELRASCKRRHSRRRNFIS